ncbi:MAG: phenylacetic acid degradation operon negative regulatory protein PaaX [Xanthomonadales bacterium]|nr:phenylacetic acid degradation operon negative regulatory protein PaaX [Xanthomonadales bacterium]
MKRLATLDKLLRHFRDRRPIRAGSLIVTTFGDSIVHHGNSVWLGNLITALEPFGLNQRLIRTSVYRLVQDDWLATSQVGRRSYYSFTDAGLRHFEKAARRIYAGAEPPWDGRWTLILAGFLNDRQRDALRRELHWLGYGTLTPGMMAHPSGDRGPLDETLAEMKLADRVTVLSATTEDPVSRQVLRKISERSWKLDELGERYKSFLKDFRPLLASLRKAPDIDPGQAFLVRTLLIHEYRRLLLRDADLPSELLPANWPGRSAHQLTANIYQLVDTPAERYIMENFESADGALPPANPDLRVRFSGLAPA